MSREMISAIARDFNKNMCSDREVLESCTECAGSIENSPCPLYEIATRIYNAGYRKQSEGEWIAEKSITESKRGRTIHSTVYRCSLCDAPNGRKKDHFCRWCGASMVASMMKGGAEE